MDIIYSNNMKNNRYVRVTCGVSIHLMRWMVQLINTNCYQNKSTHDKNKFFLTKMKSF